MNARELARRCPICREETLGGCCTSGMPFSIVLLEIDEWTPAEAVQNVQAALARAANEIAQHRVN